MPHHYNLNFPGASPDGADQSGGDRASRAQLEWWDLLYICHFHALNFQHRFDMNQKREEIDIKLGMFDEYFKRLATKHCFIFENKAGPSLGRALRIKNEMERAVFLELNERWVEADPENLNVILCYCAWLKPTNTDFPLYFFKRLLFEGRLHDLIPLGEELLIKAVEDLIKLNTQDVMRDGNYFKDLES